MTKDEIIQKNKVTASMTVAAILWYIMFAPLTVGMANFWLEMTVSAIILTTFAFFIWGRNLASTIKPAPSTVIMGVGIAILLWITFWVGDRIAGWLLPFERMQVDAIYAMRSNTPSWLISLLLLLIIGPAEEIFWRGCIQRYFARRRGANTAFILTTIIYTIIHIPSLNFMLVMAALVCGTIWGGLYRLMPQRLPAIIISHALWDAAVFVWFPITA